MKANLPILYQNIMDGLPSQFSKEVFLWATDKVGDDRYAYKAEAFARQADWLIPSLKGVIDIAQLCKLRRGGLLMDEETEKDLLRFMAARFANYALGGNVKTPMPDLPT